LKRRDSILAWPTDHVIESFRNELYPGYKTGDGIEPHCSAVSGVGTGAPMHGSNGLADGSLEADDALASAAAESGTPIRRWDG